MLESLQHVAHHAISIAYHIPCIWLKSLHPVDGDRSSFGSKREQQLTTV
jgi:hypothetical protein